VSLMVEAALAGDHALALQAFLAHLSVASLEVAEKMLDDSMMYESAYLPQFG